MLLTIIPFLSKRFGAFSYQLSTLFQNYSPSEMNGLKNLSEIVKNEPCIDERGKSKDSHLPAYNTRKGWDLCHCLHPTNLQGKGVRGWGELHFPPFFGISVTMMKDEEIDQGPTSGCKWESPGRSGWKASVFLVARGNLPLPLSRDGTVAKCKL